MANSKNKKSVIALVVMALLLVASIVLAATGAWFTDKVEKASNDFTFGKIDIDLAAGAGFTLDDVAVTTAKTVLPGCEIKYNGTINNLADAAIVGVKVSATLDEGLTWTDVGVTADPSTYYIYEMAKKEAADVSQDVAVTITLPTSLKDQAKLNGKKITVSVEIVAIQQEHFKDDATYKDLTDNEAKYNAIVTAIGA